MSMRRDVILAPLIVALLGCPAPAQPPDSTSRALVVDLPPWQRLLEGDDARTAKELRERSLALLFQDRPGEAIAAARRVVQLRESVQGADHWEAVDAREHLDTIAHLARTERARRGYYESLRWVMGATQLRAAGRIDEAERAFKQYVKLHEDIFGRDHVRTARAYVCALGLVERLADEEQYDRKAILILRRALGEDHPDTAGAYAMLARNLLDQGRSIEAEPLDRAALLIRRRVLGEEHLLTILSYNNQAYCLLQQGRSADAELAFRRVLALSRRVLGEGHPRTAMAYNNLGGCLHTEGWLIEAHEAFATALAIERKALGEGHVDTIGSLMNVAGALDDIGQPTGSEECYRKALELLRAARGAPRVRTAQALRGLATTLGGQGRSLEAEQLRREALEVFRETLGAGHPETASCSRDLALALCDQGKMEEAEAECRGALAVCGKVLGSRHPETAISIQMLARIQIERGHFEEAEATLRLAAAQFSMIRTTVVRPGLEGAAWSRRNSPLHMLAVVLARNGKPSEGWESLEQSLGRSTWDEIVARSLVSPQLHDQIGQLKIRIKQLDEMIERAARVEGRAADDPSRQVLLARREQAQESLDRFTDQLVRSHGFPEGGSYPMKRVQASLADDEAFVAWVDVGLGPRNPDGPHWAVVLRSKGPPTWIRLHGTGPDGAWTSADAQLSERFLEATVHPAASADAGMKDVIRRLAAQRIAPLRKCLDAGDGLPVVAHLIVLPSALMAGIPVELLVEKMTVSYSPSATLTTYLRDRPPPKSRGLLALGDPDFEGPRPPKVPGPLPDHGLLVLMVAPGSNAAKARPIRLAPQDVLLAYNDTPLHQIDDLNRALGQPGLPRFVRAKIRRDTGRVLETEIATGPLGVVFHKDPAPAALRRQHALDDLMLPGKPRDDSRLAPLPGSRIEVESLASLFTAHGLPARVLMNSDASEQRLEALATSGELAKTRYLLLSTHAETNARRPLRSAVILSRDVPADPLTRLSEGAKVFDGRLTAEEVLLGWRLDAELVTLSACKSGLGKHEIGEGFVGFSQSFLIAGSRSICLSLWNADDAGTALLMTRFYQNLLGRRPGLNAPMGKMAALAEAKQWLRTLPRSEALSKLGALTNGVARDKGRKLRPLNSHVLEDRPGEPRDDAPPFAHPYYWAAFVLVGNTD